MTSRLLLPSAQKDWAYFLDVDGTLINIAQTPDAAIVPPSLLAILARLKQASQGALALVSGRALSDLEHRFGCLHIPCAGQHGLERRDVQGRLWVHTPPPDAIFVIKNALIPALARYRGLLLEDKGVSLALHYRHAPRQAAHVHYLMKKLLSLHGQDLQLQKGKFVVELKPKGVDKGVAIREYLADPPFSGRRPVYIGDDQTDEHGFAAVNALGGLSIKVGKGRTLAHYRLPSVAAVHTWLSHLTPEHTNE